MSFPFKTLFSPVLASLYASSSIILLSSAASANEAKVNNEAEIVKIQNAENVQYSVINMDEAQFSEGYEDMKNFLNAANFDPLKAKAYGSPDAPLTLYNFSSYSCSHCANFHKDGLSQIHQKYIANGQLRVVFANIAFDQLGLFLTNGSFATQDLKQYMSYSAALYENQSQVFSQNAEQEVKKILKAQNMTFEELFEVANHDDIRGKMIKFLDYTSKILNINGTPSFILTRTGHSPEQALGRVEGNDPNRLIDLIEKQLKAIS